MHDIDRTLMEYEAEVDGYEADYEDEYEYDDYEAAYDDTEVFDEEEEMDLAAELLSITDDEELEQFLGSLIRKAGKKIRKFVKSGSPRGTRSSNLPPGIL